MNDFSSSSKYYALQVRTRGEEKFIRQAGSFCSGAALKLYFPQRILDVKKKGKIKTSKFSVFPGYVFLELDADDNAYDYLFPFRKIDGFFQFLKSNRGITPLKDRDLELVLHFIKTGPVAGKSKVYFDENSRIVVLFGPLKGLEGKIVNVDKRKRRARVVLDLYDESFAIDLAFDVIEKAQRLSA
jgi:transcriptional antiterminator NusG